MTEARKHYGPENDPTHPAQIALAFMELLNDGELDGVWRAHYRKLSSDVLRRYNRGKHTPPDYTDQRGDGL